MLIGSYQQPNTITGLLLTITAEMTHTEMILKRLFGSADVLDDDPSQPRYSTGGCTSAA